MFIRKEYVNHFIMLFSTPPPAPPSLYISWGETNMIVVGIRAQNHILALGPWPRTLIGQKMNKQY